MKSYVVPVCVRTGISSTTCTQTVPPAIGRPAGSVGHSSLAIWASTAAKSTCESVAARFNRPAARETAVGGGGGGVQSARRPRRLGREPDGCREHGDTRRTADLALFGARW